MVLGSNAVAISGKWWLMVRDGYDPQFGARPLKRAVQEQILNPLSLRLFEGEFKPGDQIKVNAKDGELVFEKK